MPASNLPASGLPPLRYRQLHHVEPSLPELHVRIAMVLQFPDKVAST